MLIIITMYLVCFDTFIRNVFIKYAVRFNLNGVAYDANIVEGIFHKQIFGVVKNVSYWISDKPRLDNYMKKPFKYPFQLGTSCSDVQFRHTQDCAGESELVT